MKTLQQSWTAKTAARRGTPCGPFHAGILPVPCHDAERAWRSAGVALIHAIAGRRVAVSFAEGASFSDLEDDYVNLDWEIAARGEPADVGARMLGIAAHEAAHLVWSRARSGDEPRVLSWLHNLIEDERIECALVRRYPVLWHPLDVLRRDVLRVEPAPVSRLACLLVWIRTPERLVARAFRRNQAFLTEVSAILDPYPTTPKAVASAARRIYELLPESERLEMPAHLVVRGCPARHRHDERRRYPWPRRRPRPGTGAGGWPGVPGEVASFPRTVWSDAPRDAAGYARVRREVERDASWLAERLRELLPRRRSEHARGGRLDRRRLHATPYDERAFRAHGEQRERLVLSLILDLSGSMRGACEQLAQRLAVTLAEAAARVPGVRLYAYGHTADLDGRNPTTDLVRFATPARGPVESLGQLPIGRNNRDAHAFEAIGRDLVARVGARRCPRLAIVLFDGLPDAHGFHGEAAVAATRRSVAWLEQAFGPTVLLSTKEVPTVERLGRVARCHREPLRPVQVLAGLLARAMANG
jgi:hypothetical protein